MRCFFAAIRFLTILPVPGKLGTDSDDLGGSLPYFPVVGLLLGSCAAALLYFLAPLIPAPLVAVGAVALLALFSGCLHLDGVADCADGFFSSRPRERVMEIMRDSHIGAMGVIALFFVLAIKVAALVSIPAAEIWKVIFIMPIAGRAAILLMMTCLPYARPEGGLATVMYVKYKPGHGVWAFFVILCCAWLAAGANGLISVAGTTVLLLLFFLSVYKKIGGATGDTLGSACEIAEAAFALIYACLIS